MSLRGRRKWWVAAGVVVVAAAATGVVLVAGGGQSVEARPSTSRVTRGAVTTTVSAAGTMQAQASRTLGFTSTGTLVELNVKAGDSVSVGQVLARIDQTGAQASVESAKEAVESAEDAVDNATAELAAASATPSACASTSPSAAPRPSNPSSCTSNSSNQSRNTSGTDALLTAQQRLNNAKLTLTQANAKLAGTVITAPVAGKVLSVSGAIGGQAGSNFLVLAGVNDVVVRAQFTEAEIAHLALEQPAKITLSDRQDASSTGSVIQIDPAGTISNRLVRYGALIAFDKVPDGLLYGQSANVVVTTASVENVLYVPSTAVSDRKDIADGVTGTVSVLASGVIERRTVRLGLRGDVNTEVKNGLAEGDEVLTTAVT
jgi:multidrug efflux pump subunit AcrA (membrane-fusion protein)